MDILFTSVGRRVELIQMFRRACEKSSVDLTIHGADVTRSAATAFCDNVVMVPYIREESYLPTLVKYCVDHHIDLLIPTIDTDLLLLAKNKKMFEEVGTKVLISRPEKISICRDKRHTSAYFESLGLHAPTVADDVAKYTHGFPAFIKPKDGSGSVNAYKAETQSELEQYASQIDDYIIQPFISGTEYTVDVFCDFDGNPIYITPRVRVAVRAGEVLTTTIDQDETIIDEIKTLLNDFRPCGPITVQLIKDTATKQNWYIEINPRFGGGAPLSMKAGADAALALIELMQGKEIDFRAGAAENGARYCRYDQSVRVDM